MFLVHEKKEILEETQYPILITINIHMLETQNKSFYLCFKGHFWTCSWHHISTGKDIKQYAKVSHPQHLFLWDRYSRQAKISLQRQPHLVNGSYCISLCLTHTPRSCKILISVFQNVMLFDNSWQSYDQERWDDTNEGKLLAHYNL